MSDWFTLRWSDDALLLLDQRELPSQEIYLTLRDVEQVAEAIESLAVRGAPAIGCTAAMGISLAALVADATSAGELAGVTSRQCVDGRARGAPPVLRVLLGPERARPRDVERGRRFAHGLHVRADEDRLHGGGSEVDAEIHGPVLAVA